MKDQTDWRLQNIANLAEDWTPPWSGQTALKGSQVTVVTVTKTKSGKALTLPLPNATALMINSSQRSYREASSLRRKHKIDQGKNDSVSFRDYSAAFDYLEYLMESVLTAHAGLEAFINDQIPEDYEYISNRRSDVILEVSDKAKIQRHFSLGEKISSILPEILDIKSPKGISESWGSYKKLKKLRDRITHMKTEDRGSAQYDEDTIWHSLVITEPPHGQALSVILYFAKHLPVKQRWLKECPMC